MTGCGTAADSLACLKSVPTETIRNASLVIDLSHLYNTTSYTWAAVIDGDFIQEPLTNATSSGRVNADIVYETYNTHEGENFIPPGLLSDVNDYWGFNNTGASFNRWLTGFLPGFSAEQMQQVMQLYPSTGSAELITQYDTSYVRAGLIYRDCVLACPALWLAQSAKTAGYVGQYDILPAWHAEDIVFVS